MGISAGAALHAAITYAQKKKMKENHRCFASGQCRSLLFYTIIWRLELSKCVGCDKVIFGNIFHFNTRG